MHGEFEYFLEASFKCPLHYIGGLVTTPRLFIEYAYIDSNKEHILQDLAWCDGCGICGETIKNLIDDFYNSHKEAYHHLYREHINLDINIEKEGSIYLYVGRDFITKLPKSIEITQEYLALLNVPAGLVKGPNSQILFFLDRLGYKYGKEIVDKLSSKGVKNIITIDRYSYNLLRKYVSRKEINILPLSSIIKNLVEREDIVFSKVPDIYVHILNSPYSYYRRELKTYSKIFNFLPWIHLYISKKRFGLGFLELSMNNFLFKNYVAVVNSYIPSRAKMVSTVDPILYSYLYNYLRNKSFVLSYLPNIILGLMHRI